MEKAIFIMGPPGSGKGTQAALLSDHLDGFHFDTGKYLRHLIGEGSELVTPEMRKIYDAGEIMDGATIFKLTSPRVRALAEMGLPLVFSGSPRSILEAFGKDGNGGLVNLLLSLYGKENVFVVHLDVPEGVSADRNKHRRICSICHRPNISRDPNVTTCALCAGTLKRRSDDDPGVMQARITAYKKTTEPALDALKEKGFTVIEIDGTPMPAEVFESIKKHF